MDTRLFYAVLIIGILVVVVEWAISLITGWAFQSQLRARGVVGYSFMEHGGMWADVFIISPVVAYIASSYRLAYFSKEGLLFLGIAALFSLAAGYAYQKLLSVPEVFVHDGRTSLVGWIHGLFATVVLWIILQFYSDPSATRFDIILISALLTPFFYLGVKKFSDQWALTAGAKWQVAIEVMVLWSIAGFRLWHG